jgi:hypothetical protein
MKLSKGRKVSLNAFSTYNSIFDGKRGTAPEMFFGALADILVLGKNILRNLSLLNFSFSTKANIQNIGGYQNDNKVDIIGTYLKFIRYRNIFC